MNDNAIRHLVAFAATIVCLTAYYAGWLSQYFGWWWTVFGVLIIYGGGYKIVNK